ncbi:hypothetical protein CKM354_000470800 [Cercospora kikuchii]|uniref:Uncharacterized protein n=1 Tax=Cercospora kikuchii TaxID=84275 RepID=A0A9P3FBR4_9PEZI|nr:uncharacterized protein CKM354_000470800 [Cercospora kikuchii]GIZ41403.1 hypothetical protein CKM354_000470800 [Cercospora kikuchii]
MYGKRLLSAAICCLVTIAHAAELPSEQSQLNNVNADERRSLAEAGELVDRSAEGAAVEQADAVDAEAPAVQDAGLAQLFDDIVGPSPTTLIKIAGRAERHQKRQNAATLTAPTSTVTVTTATTQVTTAVSSYPSTTIIVSTQDVTYTTAFTATTTAVSTIAGRTLNSTSLTVLTSTFTTTSQSTLATTLIQTTTAISTQPTTAISTQNGGTATQIATTFQTVTATATGPTSTVTGDAVTTTLPATTLRVTRAPTGTPVAPTPGGGGGNNNPQTGPCSYVFRYGPVMWCEGNARDPVA